MTTEPSVAGRYDGFSPAERMTLYATKWSFEQAPQWRATPPSVSSTERSRPTGEGSGCGSAAGVVTFRIGLIATIREPSPVWRRQKTRYQYDLPAAAPVSGVEVGPSFP